MPNYLEQDKQDETNIPRGWRKWSEKAIYAWIASNQDNDAEWVQWLIDDMQDELDERDYVHETFYPGEWDDADELDMPSYTS